MFFKSLRTFKSSVLPTGLLSTAGVVGFLLGKSLEKSKQETSEIPSAIRNVPAFPLFSTVSAAEPAPMEKPVQNFSSGDKLNRTSQVF